MLEIITVRDFLTQNFVTILMQGQFWTCFRYPLNLISRFYWTPSSRQGFRLKKYKNKSYFILFQISIDESDDR